MGVGGRCGWVSNVGWDALWGLSQENTCPKLFLFSSHSLVPVEEDMTCASRTAPHFTPTTPHPFASATRI